MMKNEQIRRMSSGSEEGLSKRLRWCGFAMVLLSGTAGSFVLLGILVLAFLAGLAVLLAAGAPPSASIFSLLFELFSILASDALLYLGLLGGSAALACFSVGLFAGMKTMKSSNMNYPQRNKDFSQDRIPAILNGGVSLLLLACSLIPGWRDTVFSLLLFIYAISQLLLSVFVLAAVRRRTGCERLAVQDPEFTDGLG